MSDWADEVAVKVIGVLFNNDRAAIIREYCEEKGWRDRYEEASRQLDLMRIEASRAEMLQREIDDIQIIVGCDHIEGLARCVRERVEGAP